MFSRIVVKLRNSSQNQLVSQKKKTKKPIMDYPFKRVCSHKLQKHLFSSAITGNSFAYTLYETFSGQTPCWWIFLNVVLTNKIPFTTVLGWRQNRKYVVWSHCYIFSYSLRSYWQGHQSTLLSHIFLLTGRRLVILSQSSTVLFFTIGFIV